MSFTNSITTLPNAPVARSFPCGMTNLTFHDQPVEDSHLIRTGELTVIHGPAKSGRTQALINAAASIVSHLGRGEIVAVALGVGEPRTFVDRLGEQLTNSYGPDRAKSFMGRVKVARVGSDRDLDVLVDHLTVTERDAAAAAAKHGMAATKASRTPSTVVALLVDDLTAFASDVRGLVRMAQGSLLLSADGWPRPNGSSAIRKRIAELAVVVTTRTSGQVSTTALRHDDPAAALPLKMRYNASHVISSAGVVSKSRSAALPSDEVALPEFFIDSAPDGSDARLNQRVGDQVVPVLVKAELPPAGQRLWNRLVAGFTSN